jgi:membrane carboxypeptidase/penicillin-binding protein
MQMATGYAVFANGGSSSRVITLTPAFLNVIKKSSLATLLRAKV